MCWKPNEILCRLGPGWFEKTFRTREVRYILRYDHYHFPNIIGFKNLTRDKFEKRGNYFGKKYSRGR